MLNALGTIFTSLTTRGNNQSNSKRILDKEMTNQLATILDENENNDVSQDQLAGMLYSLQLPTEIDHMQA